MDATYYIIEIELDGIINYYLLNDTNNFDQINKYRKHVVFSTNNESEAIQTYKEIYNVQKDF